MTESAPARPPTSLSASTLRANSLALKASLSDLACYDAYQALPHPHSSKEVDTKHHILVSAISLINDKGFDDITMNDVVDCCSVSRRTVYKYFANKENLASEITILWAVNLLLEISKNKLAGDTPKARIRSLIGRLIDDALKYPRLLKSVVTGIVNPVSSVVDVYGAFENETLSLFASLVGLDKHNDQFKLIMRMLLEIYIYNLIALSASPLQREKLENHLFSCLDLLMANERLGMNE
jgi:AcrR family transcriptional regulator